MSESILQEVRRAYVPKLPPVFAENGMNVTVVDGEITLPEFDTDKIQELFPNTCGLPIITFQAGANETHQVVNVGVILSGGQAPGGHNVIAGIFDGLKALNPDNKLYGFLGGPSGLIDNEYMELTTEIIDEYRNTGGFDMIRSGRTKLETEPDFDKVKINCDTLGVNAIVIIGGDDSNTNA
ncbi:MAG: 6-phosphofructokinase, partial [Lentisphaeria bacterium]|nr:6-phosphofructokinase [Lentisphaeria bacterium]